MEFNATFIISTISFLVFIFIMNSILYAPIMRITKAREDYINKNKEAAGNFEKNANSLIEDKNAKISEAHKKSRDIVATKSEAIKEEKNYALNNAKSEMSAYVEYQKETLASQKHEIYYRLKASVADLANNITSKLIGEGVSFEPLNEKEIDEVIRKHA